MAKHKTTTPAHDLLQAAHMGKTAKVMEILQKKPDIADDAFFQKGDGKYIMEDAAKKSPDTFVLLLNHGFQTGEVRETKANVNHLFLEAIAHNNPKKVQDILKRHPKIADKSFYQSGPGFYTLHIAASHAPDLIPTLIQHGFSVNHLRKKDHNGQDALQLLKDNGQTKALAAIREKMPRGKRRWLKGTTTARALHGAIKRGDEVTASEILTQHPTLFSHQYFEKDGGFYILHTAVEHAPELIPLMMQYDFPSHYIDRAYRGNPTPIEQLEAMGKDKLAQLVRDNLPPTPPPRKRRTKAIRKTVSNRPTQKKAPKTPARPTQLLKAVQAGDTRKVNTILRKYPEIASMAYFAKAPGKDIANEALKTMPDLLPMLLDHGFALQKTLPNKQEAPKALLQAIKNNEITDAKAILEHYPTLFDHHYFTMGPGFYALHIAAKHAPAIIPLLVAYHFPIEHINMPDRFGDRPLDVLEDKGEHDAIAAIMEAKEDEGSAGAFKPESEINTQDNLNATASTEGTIEESITPDLEAQDEESDEASEGHSEDEKEIQEAMESPETEETEAHSDEDMEATEALDTDMEAVHDEEQEEEEEDDEQDEDEQTQETSSDQEPLDNDLKILGSLIGNGFSQESTAKESASSAPIECEPQPRSNNSSDHDETEKQLNRWDLLIKKLKTFLKELFRLQPSTPSKRTQIQAEHIKHGHLPKDGVRVLPTHLPKRNLKKTTNRRDVAAKIKKLATHKNA